jgi:hypothetical protein
MATEAIMIFPIWDLVSSSSSLTTAISGAMPNQPKKQRKKASQDMWKALICGVFKFSRSMEVALFAVFFISKKVYSGK